MADKVSVVEDDLASLKEVLKKTFSNIKTDMSNINNQLMELKSSLTVNNKEMDRLREYNHQLEMQVMQLKQIQQTIQAQAALQAQSPKEQQSSFSPSVSLNDQVLLKIAELEKKLESQPVQKPQEKGLAAQVLRTVGRNRKSLIKKKILSVISSQDVTLPDLKSIVVDEQGLCSKATFYRYFEDLKHKRLLDIAEVDEVEYVVPSRKAENTLKQV